jgi:hypothetical protein
MISIPAMVIAADQNDFKPSIGALTLLSIEMDDLLRQVAKEQNNILAQHGLPPLDKSRSVLESLYIP